MEPVTVVIVLIVLAAVFGLIYRARGRRMQRPDVSSERSPDSVGTSPVATGPGPSMPPQVLRREALVNPDRRLDPNAWDNSPDTGGNVDADADADADVEPDPVVLDRDRLIRRERPGGEASPRSGSGLE